MAVIKQKLAFKKVLKGTPIKKAMIQVGYAKSTSETSGKLTRSKGWNELIDKYISEEALMKVHAEGLKATKLSGTGGMRIGMKTDGSIDEVGHSDIQVPDYAVRHKYLETGYKVRGRMKETSNGNPTTNNIVNIFTDEQLRRAARYLIETNRESEDEVSSVSNGNESKL